MSLRKYEGKKVVLKSIDDKIYEGIVGDYIFPDDTENNEEIIVLDIVENEYPIGFSINEIKSIKILE